MEELNTPIFAQAKVEYTAQLIDILYPHMFDGVKSIYDESKILYRNRGKTPILLIFRELLEKVPIWNSEIINSECSRIVNNSNCDYIDDLITAVFISHTKILTSIGPSQSFNKINVTIPKCSTFIHKSYINAARELWKNPYLFNENVPGHEFQKNNKEIENIIKSCIENTIRKLLPIKEILKGHLEGENDNNLLNQRETLKQLLREELKDMKSTTSHSNVRDDDDDEYAEGDNESESDDITRGVNVSSDSNYIEKSEYMGPTILKESDKDEMSADIKEDEMSELEKKLTNMVDKIEQGPITENKTENIVNELFPSTNDPTEEQVEAQCSDIVVNDITMPVEIPDDNLIDETNNPIVEVKYDNVDITDKEIHNEDHERLKRLMTNMEVKEEVNVIKSDEVANFQKNTSESEPEPEPEPESGTKPEYHTRSNYSLNSLYPNMDESTPNSYNNEELPKVEIVTKETANDENIKEDESVKIVEPKSPRKEMVSVKNDDDIDETSSLANFFDDMKQIAEDKGIVVEKNNGRIFTLFEDANEVENKFV